MSAPDVTPVDRDRAQLYGVLAALFVAPPQRAMLDTIVPIEASPDAPLVVAWNALAARATESEAAWSEEFNALFVGVGKPDIVPYGSYWLAGALHEKPLAQLREDLARLGLARPTQVSETEDHVAALCGALRLLVLRNDPAQDGFFTRHLAPWAPALCDAIDSHSSADRYRAVTGLLRLFVDVESQAVSIDEATPTSTL